MNGSRVRRGAGSTGPTSAVSIRNGESALRVAEERGFHAEVGGRRRRRGGFTTNRPSCAAEPALLFRTRRTRRGRRVHVQYLALAQVCLPIAPTLVVWRRV